MPSYDSDSSADEEKSYTETNVLLGYVSKGPKGEKVSRLGGRPEWLDEGKPASAALARCKACKELMSLLLQLNGELPERFPSHERRLFVFGCRQKSCRRKDGSIRALRSVRATGQTGAGIQETEKKEKEPQPTKPTSNPFGNSSFCNPPILTAVNPFSSSTFGNQPILNAANPFRSDPKPPTTTPQPPSSTPDPANDLPKTFAESLSLNNPQQSHDPPPPPEPWPADSALPAAYPILWIADAEYETLDPTPLPKVPNKASMDIDDPTGSSSGGGKEDKEVFESSMDSTFQKFADRVGENPEQVIRYEFGGTPLLYSKDDTVAKLIAGPSGVGVQTSGGIPRCQNCGSGRVFEVQMTPNAIAELEADEDGLDGMDWGTIIVGVCEKDCQERGAKEGEPAYLEEWVGVQWEELSARR